MILFKPYHVDLILSGRKTQTRRLGKKRWNIGAIHQAKTTMFGEAFARLRIIGVKSQLLCQISPEDVIEEGYHTYDEYVAAFCRINKVPLTQNTSLDIDSMPVWIVTFKVVKETP